MPESRSFPMSSWSTTIRRASSLTHDGSTVGCVATGIFSFGCFRSCPRSAVSSEILLPLIGRWKILTTAAQPRVADTPDVARGGVDHTPGGALVVDDGRDRCRRVATPAGPRAAVGRSRPAQSIPVFLRNLRRDAATALAQGVLSVMFLAFHAWDAAHAIGVMLVRLVVTKRRMLEWKTAATTAARATGLVGKRRARIRRRYGAQSNHRGRHRGIASLGVGAS